MFTPKRIADALTVSRALLAIFLIWLGFTQGAGALGLAVWIVIASWTSDILDGALARSSQGAVKNWVGEHDLEFDMSVAFGVWVFLAVSGYVNLWIAILYCLIWIGIFWLFGLRSALGKLFQAPVYGWFILVALRDASGPAYWLVGWVLLAILLTWPRFPNEVIPGFLSGFKQPSSR